MILFRDRRSLSLMIGLIMMIFLLSLLQEQQTGFYEPITIRINVNNSQMNSTVSSTLLSSLNESIQRKTDLNSDFSKLIDLNNFKFITNQNSCSRNKSHQPLVIILVHSAPENFSKRRTIRRTWGGRDERSYLIFLLGAVTSATLNERIVKENAFHADIVQGNFVDSYRNMTYKHVMGLKWFTYTCKKATFVLKTDDDVLVNSPFLYESLQTFFSLPTDELTSSTAHSNNTYSSSLKLAANKLILCDKIVNSKVKRTYRSKWRVSYDEFIGKFYPPYCPGFGILYTADVVHELYKKAQISRYFWIDDVHITGTLASELKIPITTGKDLFLSPGQTEYILSNNNSDNDAKKLTLNFLFAKQNLEEFKIKQLWDVVLRLQSNTLP